MTWQEEKTETQAMMREIAALIPQDVTVRVDVKETGVLFGCNQEGVNGEKLHSWTGSAAIAVNPDVDIDPLVKSIESHYREKGYNATSRLDIDGDYAIHMKPPGKGSSYLISRDGPGRIRIAGWSECFQLPEGLYPGGSF